MITMTRYQYEALLALAVQTSRSETVQLRAAIDAANEIGRFTLWVRWQDVTGAVPNTTNQFTNWPPEQQALLEMDRPIARHDVEDVLRDRAVNPTTVLVTVDPEGIVGWTQIDAHNF